MKRQDLSTTQSEIPACCQAGGQNKAKASELDKALDDGHQAVLFSIAGMSCGACAEHIREALKKLPGVVSAHVVFSDSAARVHFDPARTDIQAMVAAVAAAGYQASSAYEKPIANPTRVSPIIHAKPSVIGVAAALGIIGFYLGLITLTSDWNNAKAQFGDYQGWILSLAAGLGLQVGLLVHLRAFMARAGTRGATSSVAASGGVSTISMALCCSHYVAAFLPAIGLPFLSTAAAGLAAYQVQFFMLGVVSNLFGIGYMLRLMIKNGIVPAVWMHRPA